MEKTFTGSTRTEAENNADSWWTAQKGLRLIERTIVAIGDDSPSLSDMSRWTVTIHFEHDNSN